MNRPKLESDIGLGGRVFKLGYFLADQDFAWYSTTYGHKRVSNH